MSISPKSQHLDNPTPTSSKYSLFKDIICSSAEASMNEISVSQNCEKVEKMNQAILKCEKEKEQLLQEIARLKDERDRHKIDEKMIEKWREFPKIVENSLADLDTNIEHVANLKFIEKKMEKDLSIIK